MKIIKRIVWMFTIFMSFLNGNSERFVQLKMGYNLVGLNSNITLDTLISKIGEENLISIQGTGENSTYKKVYRENLDFLNSFKKTVIGKAYWINVETDVIFTYAIVEYFGVKKISLQNGWNMIGSVSNLEVEALVNQLGIDNLLEIQGIGENSVYKKAYLNNGLEFLNTFKKFENNKGYWIKVSHGEEVDFPIRNIVGTNEVYSTAVYKATIFVSLTGVNTGQDCSEDNPCNFRRMDYHSSNPINIEAGDIVLFREGNYRFSMDGVRRMELPGGTLEKPVLYESYANESVVFDGGLLSREVNSQRKEGKIYLEGSHISFRKIEIKNMPEFGIRILGNHNRVEGCIIHNNGLTGIEIFNGVEGFSNTPSGGSFNMVRNNKVYGNSDEGLTGWNYANGGNADGINIITGVDNIIENNVIYNNSDDGIDTYKSFGTKVDYNLVYGQGIADGNGNGLKLGGLSSGGVRGLNIYARHNIVYQNRNNGITVHGADNNVIIEYNTSFNNGRAGYTSLVDTKLNYNISLDNNHMDNISDSSIQSNNSWQIENSISFLSVNPSMSELELINITEDSFLRPTVDSNTEELGAYSKVFFEL